MKFNPSKWLNIPVERFPDYPCIKYKSRTFSYSEINERANRLAHGLMKLGMRKGSRVATLQFNSNYSIELFLAMWKTGIIMVPLNTRSSPKENVDILKDSEATTLIFGSEFVGQIPLIQKALPNLSQLICHADTSSMFIDYESLLAESTSRDPDLEVDENDIYKIHYTSGTTGSPRGVIMTYRNRKEQTANVFMNTDILIDQNQILLHVAPLTHAAGYMFTPFYLKGAKHIILDKFDPTVLLETIEKERVTCTLLVPTMIVVLLENKEVRKYDLSSLKRIFYGTAPISTVKLREAISVFGNIFRQNYGLTEAVQPLCCLTPEEHVLTGEEGVVKRLGSAGRRAIGAELRIVDENDQDVPPGEIGEIILRGPHISPGYLNLPDMTAETYKGGWLHTGDLGCQNGGQYVFIVDRKKDMIISGGFNIYSKEVEIVLDSHPSVVESAVIGVQDEKWGEIIKAFIVLKKDRTKPSEQEFIDYCIHKGLPKYKTPKMIAFIDNLPKNENGKIVKKLLKNMS